MTAKPKLSVVETIYESNARSIVDMMRMAADSIETEEEEGFSPTQAMVAIQLSESGKIQIYGWGEVDDLKAIAMMERGKFSLLATLDGDTQ